MTISKKAHNLLLNPMINATEPKNSTRIINKAMIHDSFIVSVKKFIVALNPYPPNIPNNFCAPCGSIMEPTVKRRINPVQELSEKNINCFISFFFTKETLIKSKSLNVD